jgi:hypothetical protein
MTSVQKFTSVHRQTFKERRSAALVEWWAAAT